MTAAVSVVGVVARYGTTTVLNDVSFEVAHGERVALLGSNGAGKTTLLRVITGLLRPAAGTVRVFGGDPTDATTRTRIGSLGHTPPLYPRLSALENLRFWSGVRGAEASPESLERLGIDPADRRPVETYSQGMRRRVGIACVLAGDPELVCVDEPFAALDHDAVETVARILAADGRTLLMATHEVERAHVVCHRTLTLADGRLRAEAPAP